MVQDDAYEAYIKAHSVGENPNVDTRDGQTPIGLKVCRLLVLPARSGANFGAEPRCHMLRQCLSPGIPPGKQEKLACLRTSAQVWFQDIHFRKGVYECQPTQEAQHPFEVRPYHVAHIEYPSHTPRYTLRSRLSSNYK